MIYEFKSYQATPGNAEALIKRFEDKTLPIFARLGIEVVHCWTNPEEPDKFYYLTRFESEEQRKAALTAFASDPEWKAAKAASETNGPMLASQSTLALHPTRFSPGDRR